MENVYLIYDIGKTNKKLLVFSEKGIVRKEYNIQFDELVDEDGFPCDDIAQISNWVRSMYHELKKDISVTIKAINFATYGASFLHVDASGKVLTPLYNYLKPLPDTITKQFLAKHFDHEATLFALNTASPYMGMLNSGLQLYWLKHTQQKLWQNIQYSLHLPQYFHYLFTQQPTSDYTSIGCHTGLYNVNNKQYHPWVFAENITEKLPPTTTKISYNSDGVAVGTGLHDSSAALIPYIEKYKTPFILISTGTWCIHLNPFNTEPLTTEELSKDCLCYLKVDGNPVKASRIFLGKEHEMQCKKIAAFFDVADNFYNDAYLEPVECTPFVAEHMQGSGPRPQSPTGSWNVATYSSANQAYNALMQGLTLLQKESLDLIDETTIDTFYIDGGFSANTLFKYYLQKLYPHKKIESVAFHQATALGTFLYTKSLLEKR
jgi:sugar (pentulose or hexulose) kinase